MNPKMHFAIKSFTETDAEYPGTFSLILSDPTLDRDNEVVDAKCFSASKSLPPRISMDLDHEMTVLSTVGSGVPSYTTGGALSVDGEWARTDKAQEARSLVRDGHIQYASVAYRTLKSKTDAKGIRHIVDAELLNGTFTQVPSNPNARVMSAKVGARNAKSDLEQIQAAHDAMVAVGATCPSPKKSFNGSTGHKAIDGTFEALRERIADALEDCYVDESRDWGCCSVIGVYTDTDAVVFQCYGCPDMESDETYSQTFTDDGAVVTLTGMPEVVDIRQYVTPDADADREMTVETAAGATAKAATPTAASAARLLALHAHSVAVAAQARANPGAVLTST